jgi:uncharacterized protein YegP (UPF0339 family)
MRRCIPARSVARKALGADPRTGRMALAGMFELFVDSECSFRFRLTAPNGTVVAVSSAFDDKATAAVAGIAAAREYAGTGLITDLCPADNWPNLAVATARERSIPETREDQRRLSSNPLTTAEPLRPVVSALPRTGAA